MCGGSKPSEPVKKPIPQASIKDTAQRGDGGAMIDPIRRVGATEDKAGSVLGGTPAGSAVPAVQSVLGS